VYILIDRKYKITLLGDGAVGKTSLRKNFMGEAFSTKYNMTLGSDFAVKNVEVDDSEVMLVIWDLAGQPRFSAVREAYYRGSRGALIVFDLTRAESYENLANWVAELVKNNGYKKIPIVLIGNKMDLRGSLYNTIPKKYGENYAKRLGEWSGFDVQYIETSAKFGDNVEEAFATLVRQIVKSTQKDIARPQFQSEPSM
jgi:small GTP-binding protein